MCGDLFLKTLTNHIKIYPINYKFVTSLQIWCIYLISDLWALYDILFNQLTLGNLLKRYVPL